MFGLEIVETLNRIQGKIELHSERIGLTHLNDYLSVCDDIQELIIRLKDDACCCR